MLNCKQTSPIVFRPELLMPWRTCQRFVQCSSSFFLCPIVTLKWQWLSNCVWT